MKTDKALTYLLSRLDVHGVSTIKVDDGQIFAFSTDKLERILEEAYQSEKGYVVVFIKSSPMPLES